MKFWQILFIIIVACLQVSLIPAFGFYHIIPNLISIIMMVYVILGRDNVALTWLIIGGVILDLYSPLPFGVYVFQMGLIFLMCKFIIRPYLHEPSLPFAGIVFLFLSLIFNTIIILIFNLSYLNLLLPLALLETFLATVIYRFTLIRQIKNASVKVR